MGRFFPISRQSPRPVDSGQQAHAFFVSTVRRIPVAKSVLGIAERLHLFLKDTEHSYMVLVAIAIGLLEGALNREYGVPFRVE